MSFKQPTPRLDGQLALTGRQSLSPPAGPWLLSETVQKQLVNEKVLSDEHGRRDRHPLE
jgi:hypothetical protein